MSSAVKVLVQGIGNPSRGDDALGPMLIERLSEGWVEGAFDKEWLYQLQIEQAEQWSHYDVVVVLDAHVRIDEPIVWRELEPSGETTSFSTHALSPQAVVTLNRQYYEKHPTVYLLGLQSESFGLGESLSPKAERALEAADATLARFLQANSIQFRSRL